MKPIVYDKIDEFYDDVLNNVMVYPNPANDVVVLSAVSSQLSVVKVYNMLGMLVDEIKVNAMKIELDVSDYNPGIYFFNINGEAVKVIIEN